ncbi:DUF4179 domain-containing protein [Clostridium sp. D53t1_180928_C8]|uniref:DUF4179 domain-containing protein n=1 Tax=Clostridium sp. D53t1_180928_C8 TaxID=2787101 RepID=UPI0018AC673E|nr:DUF4179 domain-containing protein [Clostridium sp. D53t1_180928_C8]
MRNIEKELEDLRMNKEICIPDSLRKKVDETYEQLEENKISKNIIKNTVKVASIAIIILVSTNFIAPTIAEEIPLVGPVIKMLNNEMGMNVGYTDNGLVVKETFNTECYSVNIETVDFDGEKILIVYKVIGIKKNTPWPCVLDIDIKSDSLIINKEASMATGGIEEGAYYGYQQYDINFNNENLKQKEIQLNITPKVLIVGDDKEEFINEDEINLNVKNKNYR